MKCTRNSVSEYKMRNVGMCLPFKRVRNFNSIITVKKNSKNIVL